MTETKKKKKCPAIHGKGHEILSVLNIDYSEWLGEIVGELMAHPDSKYSLKLLKKYN